MDKITKLSVLDACIGGSIDKMNQLLNTSSDHFDIFYNLCKTINPRSISDITFSEIEDHKASFVITTNKSDSSSDLFNEVNNCNVELIPVDTQKLNVVISVHS